MRYVKLGEVCSIQSGGTPKRSKREFWEDGTIPWVKISDIEEKYIHTTEEKITEAGLMNSSAKLFEPGTVLFSIFATLGAVGILQVQATTNQAIAGLKSIDDSVLRNDYLYIWLKSQKELAERTGRGVAQNNINLSILKNLTIPLPSPEIQKAIVAKFEKIDSLLLKLNECLIFFDDLVKSRFIFREVAA